jgi:HEAT repeat protein
VLVVAWFSGCTEFYGTTAASFLRQVRDNPDPNVRYIVYGKLASPNCYDDEHQKEVAARTLIRVLEHGREPIASQAVICRTLGELHAQSARQAIIKVINDPDPGVKKALNSPELGLREEEFRAAYGIVRQEACRALGKVGRPEDATILARIMSVDPLEDCRIAAIEGLGELKSKDPRILDVLVENMDHDDPAIRLASLKALRKITGKDLGVEPAAWRKHFHPEIAVQPATGSANKPATMATNPPTTTRR